MIIFKTIEIATIDWESLQNKLVIMVVDADNNEQIEEFAAGVESVMDEKGFSTEFLFLPKTVFAGMAAIEKQEMFSMIGELVVEMVKDEIEIEEEIIIPEENTLTFTVTKGDTSKETEE